MSRFTLSRIDFMDYAGDCVLEVVATVWIINGATGFPERKTFRRGYSRGSLSHLGMKAIGDEQKFYNLMHEALRVEIDEWLEVLNVNKPAE